MESQITAILSASARLITHSQIIIRVCSGSNLRPQADKQQSAHHDPAERAVFPLKPTRENHRVFLLTSEPQEPVMFGSFYTRSQSQTALTITITLTITDTLTHTDTLTLTLTRVPDVSPAA